MIICIKDEILKKFGEHVKDLRTKSGLTQDEAVLNSSKITKSTVSDIENGKRNFAFITLINLAKGLNISPKDLLNFKIDWKFLIVVINFKTGKRTDDVGYFYSIMNIELFDNIIK